MEAFGVHLCNLATSRCSLPIKSHSRAHLACPLQRDKPNGVAWIFYPVSLPTHENRDSLQATRHKRHSFSRLIVIGKRLKSWSYGKPPPPPLKWQISIDHYPLVIADLCYKLNICHCSHRFPLTVVKMHAIRSFTCYLQQSRLCPIHFTPSAGNSLWGQQRHLYHNFQPRDVAEWRKWLGRVIFATHGRFWWPVIGFCPPKSESGVLKESVNGDVTWFGESITPKTCNALAIANWESRCDTFLHWLLWQPQFPRDSEMTFWYYARMQTARSCRVCFRTTETTVLRSHNDSRPKELITCAHAFYVHF